MTWMAITRMPNSATVAPEPERQVLVAAPTGRDAEVICRLLQEAGLSARRCDSAEALRRHIEQAAALAIITEEVLDLPAQRYLAETLARQPEWSDFPLIVMTLRSDPLHQGRQLLETLQDRAHTVLLQRPVGKLTLLSSVRAALQSRLRQYQVRDELRQRRHAEAQLREADRRKDEFLATLAHELRNPLAPIRYAFDILKLGLPPDPGTHEAGEMIERQLRHMVRLIDDLLDVSRITRGKLQLRRERVELTEILQQALAACRSGIEAAGQRLRVTLPPGPIPMDADPVRLTQVFVNLLNNACKYTGSGGDIELRCEAGGDTATVQVRDTGIGIAHEQLSRLFEMFAQIDTTPERPQSGLGIGLALARSLVMMHDGDIQAHSDGPGRGSEFTVRLPVQTTTATAATTPGAAGDAGNPSTRRVLVVDDNPDIVLSLGMILRLHGHEVASAHDGLEALAVAEQFSPQVILLDLGMPKLDGYATCQRLRERPAGHDVVIIALTGWGQDDDRRKTRKAGFDDHLVKPVEAATLLRLLATLE